VFKLNLQQAVLASFASWFYSTTSKFGGAEPFDSFLSPEGQVPMSAADRQVFISYSHADVAWLERLRVHLRPLERRNALDIWDDSRISPGHEWQEEIGKALARARIAVPLVSADFLASDFVVNNELAPLLQRASRGGLLIVPLIVSPCLFSAHEGLSRYQCANSPDKPLSGMAMTDAEAVLVSLSKSIDQYFRRLDSSRSAAEIPESPVSDPLAVERPLNLGFDSSAPEGIPIGWFNSFGHVSGVSTDYDIGVVPRSEDLASGTCAVLEKAGRAEDQFGSLMQRCPAGFLAGRTVRFEGELRSENLSGWAGLWLRADAEERPNLFFDNMSRRPVVGTTEWRRYHIDAPIPSNTDWLNYGIVLSGTGTLYADNLRVLMWNPNGRWEDV
jgi:hypothetical protein